MNYQINNNFLTREEIGEVNFVWPNKDWPGWVRYEDTDQIKNASNDRIPIPYFCSYLLMKIATCPIIPHKYPGSVPDLSLYGGGLHEMYRGGKVGSHLDADGHFRLGITRVWSAVLYVHPEWKPSYGGELVFPNHDVIVSPTPGSLIIFDCKETIHLVKGWNHELPRRSLALFGYTSERSNKNRPRAEFTGE